MIKKVKLSYKLLFSRSSRNFGEDHEEPRSDKISSGNQGEKKGPGPRGTRNGELLVPSLVQTHKPNLQTSNILESFWIKWIIYSEWSHAFLWKKNFWDLATFIFGNSGYGSITTFCSTNSTSWTQSHYREVARWEIFMEQKLRFGLDLGRFGNFWGPFFLMFSWTIFFLNTLQTVKTFLA